VSVIPGTDAAFNLLGLAIGVVVAPIIAIGLGLHIERAASRVPAPARRGSA
jgi:hypothetical protein